MPLLDRLPPAVAAWTARQVARLGFVPASMLSSPVPATAPRGARSPATMAAAARSVHAAPPRESGGVHTYSPVSRGQVIADDALSRYSGPCTVELSIDGRYTARQPDLPLAPDTEILHEIPLSQISLWDVNSIRATIDRHDMGLFYQSALLADWMLRDDRVMSTLGTRTKAVLKQPFGIKPNPRSKNRRRAMRYAKALEDDWSLIWDKAHASEMIRWSSTLGFSLTQLIWDTTRTRWVPILQPFHPAYSWWLWSDRRYVVTGLNGMRYLNPGDGKWMVHAPHSAYRGWYYGAVRALARIVALRQYTLNDWGRASEMYGMGVRLGYVPANCSPDDRQAFLGQLANFAAESCLILPREMNADGKESGFDFDIKSLDNFKGDGFEALGHRCDMAIQLVYLGQNLTSEVKEGSLAAARVHGDVRQDYLEADTGGLSASLTDQVVWPWCRFNFSDADPNDTPIAYWDCEPPEDLDVKSRVLGQVGDGLTKLRAAGAPVDVPALLAAFEIPQLAAGDSQLPPAPPGMPPPPDAQADDEPAALPTTEGT